MKNYNWYTGLLQEPIDEIKDLVREGNILLNDYEKLDFYFKMYLNGSTIPTNSRIRKIAKLMSDTMFTVHLLGEFGFTGKKVRYFCKKLCRVAYSKGISNRRYYINSYDSQGTLYIDFNGKSYTCTGIEEMTNTLLEICSILCSSSIGNSQFENFVRNYLTNTYSDIISKKTPIIYIHRGTVRTLKTLWFDDLGKKVIKFNAG